MSRKVFTAGEVLAASDVNNFLMDQTVMTFAGTAARGSAIGTAVEGMVSYLEDSDTLSIFNGTQWITNRPLMTFASSAARGSAIPTPREGMMTYLNDTDQIDVYDGSAWVRRVSTSLPFAEAAGKVSVNFGSVTTVTFPVGRFTVAPIITLGQEWVTASGGRPSAWPYVAYDASGGSTSTYMLLELQASAAATRVWWRATQMTSTTAAG